MSQIELRERFFGSGYTGTVDISPALSWADSNALRRAADGSMATALGLRRMTDSLDALGGSLVQALTSLEQRLGLELYTQTRLLEEQLGALERIEQALRRPGQTRAAERTASAGELLRRGRYERALADSRIATEEDPNNPGGFVASAWALLGLCRAEEAKSSFVEAAEASDDDERAEYFRHAGRLAFVDGDSDGALLLLSRADGRLSDFAKCALSYDRAVYLAAQGDVGGAQDALRWAVEHHEPFAYMAIADPAFMSDSELRRVAESALDARQTTLEAHRNTAEEYITAVREAINEAGQPLPVKSQDDCDRLLAASSELEAALAEMPADSDSPLTTASSHVEGVEARALALRESTTEWSAETASQRLYEQKAKVAAELELEARKLAAQHAAMPLQKPDGSWVVVRKRALGHSQAWRVSVTDSGIHTEEISWRDRYRWD
jgi:tetratricopeptide (TPR) repeat protein